MRNFGRRHSFVVLTAVAVWLSVSAAAAEAQTARARYVAAVEKDEKVRVQLTDFKDKTPPADLISQVTQVHSRCRSAPRSSGPSIGIIGTIHFPDQPEAPTMAPRRSSTTGPSPSPTDRSRTRC